MGANGSPERVRRDIMGSTLRQMTGYRLAFDCGSRRCWGERTIDIGTIAERQSGNEMVGHLMGRLRCVGCGRKPTVFHLESGPRMAAQRGGWRRVMLQGLFAIEDR